MLCSATGDAAGLSQHIYLLFRERSGSEKYYNEMNSDDGIAKMHFKFYVNGNGNGKPFFGPHFFGFAHTHTYISHIYQNKHMLRIKMKSSRSLSPSLRLAVCLFVHSWSGLLFNSFLEHTIIVSVCVYFSYYCRTSDSFANN